MPETLHTKCSPNRIVEVMKSSPSERKLKALRKMGFSGITTIQITSIGNEFMHCIMDIWSSFAKFECVTY